MRDLCSWWTGRKSTLACSVFTVPWHVSCHCLFWKGQKLLPHDKAVTSSTPPELKHLCIFLSKILIYFMVKWLGSHTMIGQGREKNLQQLKSTSQDLSSVQTSVREGCGLLPAGYPPYSLIPTCFKHWIHSATLHNVMKLCLSFLVYTAHEVSTAPASVQKRTAATAPVCASSWNAAGASSGTAWPPWQSLATAVGRKKEKHSGSLLSCCLE